MARQADRRRRLSATLREALGRIVDRFRRRRGVSLLVDLISLRHRELVLKIRVAVERQIAVINLETQGAHRGGVDAATVPAPNVVRVPTPRLVAFRALTAQESRRQGGVPTV